MWPSPSHRPLRDVGQLAPRLSQGSSRERGRALKNCTNQTVFNSLHLERERGTGQMRGRGEIKDSEKERRDEEKKMKGLGDCF